MFIPEEFRIPSVITGFTEEDIIDGLLQLSTMINSRKPELRNSYSRVVKNDGNPDARAIIEEVFEPVDAVWRGFGVLPGSGLKLKSKYSSFNSENRFEMPSDEPEPHPGCRCGDVVLGKILPVAVSYTHLTLPTN